LRTTAGRAVLPALAASLLSVPPAFAAPVVVGDAGAEPLPALAVDRGKVFWLRLSERFGTPADVVAAAPGAPEQVLLRGPQPAGSGVEQLGWVAAGGGFVAATLTDYFRTEETVRVLRSGLWSGPPRPELPPVPLRDGETAGDVAIADRRLVALVHRGSGRRPPVRLVTRDLTTGALGSRRLDRDTMMMVAAGRWIATFRQRSEYDRTRVTVRDARTWRAVTRIAVAADAIEIAAALRPDGTLALVYGFDRLKLALVPRGAKRLRRVRARPQGYAVRFAGGAPLIVQGGRIVRVRPGRAPRPLTPRFTTISAFDASGGLLAWRTRTQVLATRLTPGGPSG
jgi:hypothetical protein